MHFHPLFLVPPSVRSNSFHLDFFVSSLLIFNSLCQCRYQSILSNVTFYLYQSRFLLSATQCRLKLLCPFIFSVLRYAFFLFRRFHLCVSRVSSPSVCFCPFLRPLGLSYLPIVSPTLRLSKCLNLCSLGRVRFLCFHRWRSFVEGAEKRKYALL